MCNHMMYVPSLVQAAGAGTTIEALGLTITSKVGSVDTNGAWALLECTAAPHFPGLPPHWHAQTTACFYILDGTVAFVLGEETITARRGATVSVTPDTVHTCFNPTADPIAFLLWLTPGDVAGYFTELTLLIAAAPAWPPADPSALLALAARYDVFLPPAPDAVPASAHGSAAPDT
jgi:mannose-6-phosphate isomerase-like protein (cupin superfamily)